MPTCMHTGRFISVPLCSGQSELASVCLFNLSNLIINLMYNIKKLYFNLISHGLFLNRQSWGTMSTGVKLDVFYTMVTKRFVTSLLSRHYDVITCILVYAWA